MTTSIARKSAKLVGSLALSLVTATTLLVSAPAATASQKIPPPVLVGSALTAPPVQAGALTPAEVSLWQPARIAYVGPGCVDLECARPETVLSVSATYDSCQLLSSILFRMDLSGVAAAVPPTSCAGTPVTVGVLLPVPAASEHLAAWLAAGTGAWGPAAADPVYLGGSQSRAMMVTNYSTGQSILVRPGDPAAAQDLATVLADDTAAPCVVTRATLPRKQPAKATTLVRVRFTGVCWTRTASGTYEASEGLGLVTGVGGYRPATIVGVPKRSAATLSVPSKLKGATFSSGVAISFVGRA